MLGGSFWIAFLRNTISVILMMTFFLMLDRPRFSMKKTIWCYVIFGVSLIGSYSAWYYFATASFVKFASLSSLFVIGLFCGWMSCEVFYLSLYKMAFAFYMFSVCTFCGVDAARWWFHGNLWVDIGVRAVCLVVILVFTWKKLRGMFLSGVDFLIEEMDLFSAVTLFISILTGAVVAYWPNLQGFSVFNMVRAFTTLFMAGVIQYAILHLYIHLGQEHYYQKEKELLEENEQLLRRQMELMRESEQEAARIRHDVRHHILLIREYIKKGEYDSLLDYLEEYSADVESSKLSSICGNQAVNSILSAYARKAESHDIKVNMDVVVPRQLAIRDVDWVAILANVFENAIHGCLSSGRTEKEIDVYIAQKGNKMIIRFSNTSDQGVDFSKGLPKSGGGSGLGVPSVVSTASRYHGETDFSMKGGMFVARIILNLPAA